MDDTSKLGANVVLPFVELLLNIELTCAILNNNINNNNVNGYVTWVVEV